MDRHVATAMIITTLVEAMTPESRVVAVERLREHVATLVLDERTCKFYAATADMIETYEDES